MTYKLRTVILIATITIVTLQLSAQKFNGGFLGGLSTSQIDGDTQKGFNKLGLFTGVFIETDISNNIAAKVELYYIGKGAIQNLSGVEVFKTQLNYVEMPFLLKFGPIKKVTFDLGFAFSYLISAKMYNYGEEYPQGLVDIHNTDFSAIISASYYFTEKWAFNTRFDYSIVPVANNPNWYNSNISFGFIYLF